VQRLALAGAAPWPPFIWAVHRCTARCHLPAHSPGPDHRVPIWCCCA